MLDFDRPSVDAPVLAGSRGLLSRVKIAARLGLSREASLLPTGNTPADVAVGVTEAEAEGSSNLSAEMVTLSESTALVERGGVSTAWELIEVALLPTSGSIAGSAVAEGTRTEVLFGTEGFGAVLDSCEGAAAIEPCTSGFSSCLTPADGAVLSTGFSIFLTLSSGFAGTGCMTDPAITRLGALAFDKVFRRTRASGMGSSGFSFGSVW